MLQYTKVMEGKLLHMQSKKRKLQSSKGFSLSEMLVAMLILTLTISIVSGGVVVVKEAYEKITIKADAQVLLSTAVSALSEEFRNAQDMESDSFYSPLQGGRVWLESEATDNNIYIVSSDGLGKVPLVTRKTIPKNLKLKLDSLTYVDGVFTCHIEVRDRNNNLHEEQEISVRSLNAS